jgi:SAM-dependent methyltransferase|tara:strand:- start:514 stop:1173 length:660 start_codon:yes stop_codon:yes gene_type:complete
MGNEINLMQKYPRTKRDIKQRGLEKTEEDRAIASKFGKDFFDGDRKNGYGGFDYNPRFWHPVVPDFKHQYNLTENSSILDVGCAKGFMINDFSEIIPGINVKGIDISKYAIENCMTSMKENVQVADARDLPFEDNTFDLVISITTIHNFGRSDCIKALQEIERVSNKDAFITVDAYRNDLEKEAMMAWNLTAKTILHTNEWKLLFEEANYYSDYYWFMP